MLPFVATESVVEIGGDGLTKTLRPMGRQTYDPIIIDRTNMDLLGIEPEEELELTPHDGGLLLRPVAVARDKKASARAASLKVRKIHRAALKELAE